MSHANIFRLPALRLRGKIVFAAAAVFTIAIGATLAYVLTTAHNTDLAAADSQVANLAQAKADEINLYLSPYAAAAASLARTAEVLLANPNIGPELYKSVAAAQLGDLPDALSTLMMFHSDAGLATRPSFVGSAAILSKDYVGFDAERDPADASKRVFKSLDPSATKVGYEDWFEAPLATGQPSITGPTNYAGVLYTSFDGIIHDATGKAVGITSVSFNGAVLAKTLAADASASPTSFVGIINQDGNWVQYIDPKQIGQPVKDQFALDAMAALKTGVPLYQRTDPYLGDTWRLTAIKAKLPGSDQEWTVLVSKPEAVLLKASNEQMRNMLIGSGIVLVLGLLAFAGVGTYIARPVIRMTGVMGKIADGQFDIDVPYATRADEIGDMSKTLEVFRARGIELSKMTEAEAARVIRDAKTQADTLTGLQMAFGEVVDAAIAGNFTKRVEANLGFDQLNAIANGINKLVETVGRGLTETGDVLAALADTNLTRRVGGDFQGAFAKLKDDTNAVGDKLTEVVTQLRDTSRSLKMATGEILAGANDLSERTTKQAATIEETSAAMEQLANTVTDNAKKAEDASSNADGVTRTAEEGGQVMEKANLAMESITASSGKISNIIGMIDDIAFQTNLLALNASVEAARAGDAGKGFAVVAVEVRRLAQSSAQASSDIKVLIQQSATEVDSGSRLVADASGKLAAMLEAVRQNNALLGGIAVASRQQASSIREVNTAVREMDEMTQHNAALVEQINASIEQTESQASELDRIVEVFTIEETRTTTRPMASPAGGRRPVALKAVHGQPTNTSTRTAKSAYLSNGNAAISKDWAEF